jgi:hypothetical protein
MSFTVANLVTLPSLIFFTSTAGATTSTSTFGIAVDLAPYINVGKRPVKVVCSAFISTNANAASTSYVAQFYLYQCTSSNGTFATVSTASTGATITLYGSTISTAVTSTNITGLEASIADFNVTPTSRWVYVYVTLSNVTATLPTIGVTGAVQAFSRSE